MKAYTDSHLLLLNFLENVSSHLECRRGVSECDVFIVDTLLYLSLCHWQLQSTCGVNHKHHSICALTDWKGDKPNVLFC
jgi:hypothetical protein